MKYELAEESFIILSSHFAFNDSTERMIHFIKWFLSFSLFFIWPQGSADIIELRTDPRAGIRDACIQIRWEYWWLYDGESFRTGDIIIMAVKCFSCSICRICHQHLKVVSNICHQYQCNQSVAPRASGLNHIWYI